MMITEKTLFVGLRSILFVPADRPDLLAKAAAGDADAICIDLEDAVSPDAKMGARRAIGDAADTARSGGKRVFIRINNEPDLIEADLAVAAKAGDAIVLPKAGSPTECAQLKARLENHQKSSERCPALVAQVETAAGLLTFANEKIGSLAEVVDALTIGTEDLSENLNCSPDASPVRTGFDMLALAAGASGIPLFGFPGSISEFTDLDRFRSDVETGKQAGASGAFCIHPKQVGIINERFTPADHEITEARRIVDAFEAAMERHAGAIKLDGRMIDRPVYLRALAVLKSG